MTLLRRPARLRRSSAAALTALALCAGVTVGGSSAAAGAVTVPPAVDTINGTIGTAAYTIKMPADWNGTLLLWNHGIRSTFDLNRAPEHGPPHDAVDEALLGSGYALAGSSYRSNGWAVRDAVEDDVALLALFRERFGAPERTFVWGASLGGLITQLLAEERPDLVTGTAPACGALAGGILISEMLLDAIVMAQAMFLPDLKVAGYTSDQEAMAEFDRLRAAVTGKLSDPATQAGAVGRVLALAALLDLPLQTTGFNGATTASQAGAAAEGLLTLAGAGMLGQRDSVARVGGLAVGNVGIDYRKRADDGAIARFEALGLPGSLLRSYAATLDRRVVRLAADPAARAELATMGQLTGEIRRPTVTMHTTQDPFVVAGNSAEYGRLVRNAGEQRLLTQLYIAPPAYADRTADGGGAPYGAGHCRFTADQYLAQLDVLETFVETGQRPFVRSVRESFTGVPGLHWGFRPIAWQTR